LNADGGTLIGAELCGSHTKRQFSQQPRWDDRRQAPEHCSVWDALCIRAQTGITLRAAPPCSAFNDTVQQKLSVTWSPHQNNAPNSNVLAKSRCNDEISVANAWGHGVARHNQESHLGDLYRECEHQR
jgi:hypothetical protein